MELVDFLRARLDEDERIARAACEYASPEWHLDEEYGETVLWWPPEFHTRYEEDKHWRGLTVDASGLAPHIARHDPARVLIEVEAKRATIADYEKAVRKRDGLEPNTAGYRHWDNRAFGLYVALRHAVAVYADCPGYAEALAAEQAALLADD